MTPTTQDMARHRRRHEDLQTRQSRSHKNYFREISGSVLRFVSDRVARLEKDPSYIKELPPEGIVVIARIALDNLRQALLDESLIMLTAAEELAKKNKEQANKN